MSYGRRSSFIVRIVEDERGEMTGVVERVATGAKERFTGLPAIGRVIARMVQRGRAFDNAGVAAYGSGARR